MRISDHPFMVCALVLFALGASSAHTFEVKDGPADANTSSRTSSALPSSALPALPAPTVPGLGVDLGIRRMWHDYMHSYQAGDKKAAHAKLEDAANKGDLLAIWKLARMHADGDGVKADEYRAFQLYSRIADMRGDESRESLHAGIVAHAFVALGLYWMDGIPGSPVKANRTQSARLFNYAATYYGNADAQYHLARLLLDGTGVPPDPKLAARWLSHAAEKGHVLAQALLGRMMVLGENMPRQTTRGLMWLQVARDNASAARERWVIETHEKAFAAATEVERTTAKQLAERYTKATEKR
jgi:uncharacterized protein